MDEQGTQQLETDQNGTWLPLANAAAQIGVSVKTARRRVKLGELMSRHVGTAHGLAYEVWLPSNGSLTTQTSRVHGASTQRVDEVTTVELVRLVDRLQRENRDLAGLVGALQERVGTLTAQLALAAPREASNPEIAPGADNVANEPTQTPAATSKRAAWWAPWRR